MISLEDLGLIPTGHLRDALLARYEHAALIGMQITQEGQEIDRTWVGNRHTVMGLLADLTGEIAEEIRRSQDEAEGAGGTGGQEREGSG